MPEINQYKRGKRHGIWNNYYNSFKLWEGCYDNGLSTGHWIYNNTDGTIRQQGSYDNGYQIGLWEYYDINGILNKTSFYAK